MKINANFESTVIVHAQQLDWIVSPMPGVERKPLDRVGEELARATSIVRYAPGSHFSPHVHTGGEEFFVLEGVFQDEHADYPLGTYVRNPPQSSHTPGSELGCTIFVKLWQFEPEDRYQMTAKMQDVDTSYKQCLLENAHEKVSFVTLMPNETFVVNNHKGLEVFMLAGEASLQSNGETFGLAVYSWLRQPVGESLKLTAKGKVQIWCKQDHLGGVEKQLERVGF
ncbi:MAG: anti-sigma factor ChrR (cupin superfamily) [Alphaproteobacteria bacterium]|jgi:anti-sigma factor ChrR (cupin superfamily)